MEVVQVEKLMEFGKLHAASRSRLATWYRIVHDSSYRNFSELRKTFSAQVDYVAPFHVFNIGDKYRLIAAIDFVQQRVIIRHILTHKKYDQGTWKI